MQAGVVWDDLVAHSVRAGWSGLAPMSGIPGLTGATPVQNVGAYGSEVADTITRLRVYDREAREIETGSRSAAASASVPARSSTPIATSCSR